MNLPELGDLLAIPFFGLLIKYFWDKPDKTDLEHVLLGFGIAGFVADMWWTFVKT